MAKGYWVVTYRSISKPEALAAYGKLLLAAVSAAGGRFLVRGTAAHAFEGGLAQRTVVIEFPSLEHALAARRSAGYQEALQVLGPDSVDRDIRVAEGVD